MLKHLSYIIDDAEEIEGELFTRGGDYKKAQSVANKAIELISILLAYDDFNFLHELAYQTINQMYFALTYFVQEALKSPTRYEKLNTYN